MHGEYGVSQNHPTAGQYDAKAITNASGTNVLSELNAASTIPNDNATGNSAGKIKLASGDLNIK